MDMTKMSMEALTDDVLEGAAGGTFLPKFQIGCQVKARNGSFTGEITGIVPVVQLRKVKITSSPDQAKVGTEITCSIFELVEVC